MSDPYTLAAWRFEQIAPLIDRSLSASQRRAAVRLRTHVPVSWPLSDSAQRRGESARCQPIPPSTLYRWHRLYLALGYEGLLPKARADRGQARTAGVAPWVSYAIGLLLEQPGRSLTQLELYLQLEFADYQLSRSSLARHLKAHPAYATVQALRHAPPSRQRRYYEAQHPHEGWQLDGKGPFAVRLQDGSRVDVHVLSVLDDYSRYILAAQVGHSEDTANATIVLERAAHTWGLPDRFQFDLGSAFESHAFRHGIAQLGVHRNAVKPGTPEYQGKIEAYHRALIRWFVNELSAQQVLDLAHLQQLLEAMLALLYNRHPHRELGMSPEQRLAGRVSERRVSPEALERAFFIDAHRKPHPKTGEVKLGNGRFVVPAAYAQRHNHFRFHPVHAHRAVLVTEAGHELALEPLRKQPLSAVKPQTPASGTGQLQKLLDLWRGQHRPNAQPGFGLPEVFDQLSTLLGRPLPHSARDAQQITDFYRIHGPLPREPFQAACARTAQALGTARPLQTYLDDLARQMAAIDPQGEPNR